MTRSMHDAYLEAEVLNADPVQLVRLLYRGAIEAVGAARQHVRAGRIAERSKQITRATEIVAELAQSLDHEQGGDLSRRLAGLYDYVQHLLVEANVKQVEPPLAEAEKLLTTLAEAWETCQPARERKALPASSCTQPPAVEPDYVPISCTY